jgi:hypothetical protein
MNIVQQWLNDIAFNAIVAIWNFVSAILYWVCADGIVICLLIYISCKRKKSLEKAVIFFFGFLIIYIIKYAIANA